MPVRKAATTRGGGAQPLPAEAASRTTRSTTQPRRAANPNSPRAAKQRDAAIRTRLLAAIERKLARIEEREAMDTELTAADSEREAREIGLLIRNYEKLKKLETEAVAPAKGAAGKAAEGKPGKGALTTAAKGDDAERWREELAKRIERVRQQWLAAGGAS